MTPAELLTQALAKLQTANRIDGTKNSYRRDNSAEYAAVVSYLQGGSRPNATSDMGVELVGVEDARRALAVAPEPEPEPPPVGLSVDRATMKPVGGTVLRQDDGSAADPRPGLWGTIEAAMPGRHVQVTGADPYRTLTVLDGDESFGNNARAQLGRNERTAGENTGSSTNGTFALFNEGEHKLTFVSMRFPAGKITDEPGQLADDHQHEANPSLRRQWLAPWHCIQVDLFSGKLVFQMAWTTLWETPAPVFDKWIRFAFDVTYTKDPSKGRIQFFVDRDGIGVSWSG